jgi:tRNA(fMet)-specific endonuclease VapC
MRFLLDTNAIIFLLTKRSAPLTERVLRCSEGEIGVSAIVVYELYFGAHKSQRVESNLETIRLLLHDFPVIPFDADDAREAGQIRSDLQRQGQPIGPYDTLIAGQARARKLTLISNNTKEFIRVQGLSLQDWTAP